MTITFTAHCRTGMQMIEEAVTACQEAYGKVPYKIKLSRFWQGQLQETTALMVEEQPVLIEYTGQAKYTIHSIPNKPARRSHAS